MTIERPDLPPVLKWAGGKRWLVETLRPYYDRKRRFVDPFSGGLSLPLGLRPDRALLSDANPHLMNLYRWMRHGLEYDDALGIDWVYDKTVYYENRSKFNSLSAARQYWTKEGALLFYYLNRTGYNGLCRFNRRGGFNVPFGRHASITYTRDFSPYRAAFAAWEFTHGDFAALPLAPDDAVYADPPYDVPFTHYAAGGFAWADQVRLAEWLAAHPGPVLLSNQATPRIVALYTDLGYALTYHDAPRMISRTGDRTPAREVLATRNLAPS